MIPLPPEKAGADNDLNEKIERYIKRAIEEKQLFTRLAKDGDQKKIHQITKHRKRYT